MLLAALCTFWSHRPGETPADAGCLSCHRGIETASASHVGCVSCHGGDPKGATKEAAHAGIYGIANPSFAGRWALKFQDDKGVEQAAIAELTQDGHVVTGTVLRASGDDRYIARRGGYVRQLRRRPSAVAQ